MFEICKNLSSPDQGSNRTLELAKTRRGIVAFPQPQVEEVGSLNSRCLEFITLRKAKCGIFLAERGKYVFHEPRRIAKLEGHGHVAWQNADEILKELDITF